MHRQQARVLRAEQKLQGRALLDADDYPRVEERIDAAAELRRTYTAMRRLAQQNRQVLELVAVDGLSAVEAARALSITPASRAGHTLVRWCSVCCPAPTADCCSGGQGMRERSRSRSPFRTVRAP
jgi:FixJ family two-component response regulator